jgi:hypothetical protein
VAILRSRRAIVRTRPRGLRHPFALALPQHVALYAVCGGLWLSGALWLLFHYLLARPTAFGSATHPLEAWWLTAHGAFAFAAIFSFGLLWGVHVAPGWKTQQRRPSGAAAVAAVGWLMLTGYLMYYLAGEQPRLIVATLHWTIGLATPLLFVFHGLRARGVRRVRHVLDDRLSRVE